MSVTLLRCHMPSLGTWDMLLPGNRGLPEPWPNTHVVHRALYRNWTDAMMAMRPPEPDPDRAALYRSLGIVVESKAIYRLDQPRLSLRDALPSVDAPSGVP